MIDIFSDIVPAIFTLVVVIAILYLSFLTSRYMAVGSAKLNQSKNMKVIDKLVLGQDKMIMIVQVGDKYFLNSVTSSNINVLAELNKDDLTLLENDDITNTKMGVNFKDMMSKLTTKK